MHRVCGELPADRGAGELAGARAGADVELRVLGVVDELADGQGRAQALLLLGVKESQIESVSLGEEKPHAMGHDEAAWAENRRVDIRYQGE